VACCCLAGARAGPAGTAPTERRAAVEKELADIDARMSTQTAKLQASRQAARDLHAELYERRRQVLADVPRATQIETQIRQLQKELDALRAELSYLKENHPDVKKLQEAQQKSLTETREAGQELGRLAARKRALERELAALPAAPDVSASSPTGGVK
jgi:chromosome segregation ATPase